MTNKQKGFAVLGVLLLAEAFLDNAVSKSAKAVGVNGATLAILGLVASAVVTAME